MARYITTYEELLAISMNDDVVLGASITLPTSFPGIGTASAPFTGKFNGNGFLLNKSSSSAWGIFNDTGAGAEILNVNVGGDFRADGGVGIVGTARGNTTMTGCHTTASFHGNYAGGMIGEVANGTVTLTDCSVVGDEIKSDYSSDTTKAKYAGGMVGRVSAGCTLIMKGCLVGIGINNTYSTHMQIQSTASAGDYPAAGGLVGGVFGTATATDCVVYLGTTSSITASGSSSEARAAGLMCAISGGTVNATRCIVFSKNSSVITVSNTGNANATLEAINNAYRNITDSYFKEGIAVNQDYGTKWTVSQFGVQSNYPSGFKFTASSTGRYWIIRNSEYPRIYPKTIVSYRSSVSITNTGITVDEQLYNFNGTSAYTPRSCYFNTIRRADFKYYNTLSSGSGTTYYANGTYVIPATSGTMLLYAIYDQYYTITYSAGDYSGSPPSTVEAKIGTSVTLGSMSRKGYSLAGWKCSYDGVTYAANASYTIVASDVTMTAQWTENTYNIRYDYALGSAGSYAPTSASFSSTVRISNPVRAGFTFTGWQAFNITTDTAKRGTSSPASTAWDGTATTDQYFQGLNKNNEYTVTLTAVWRVNRFNIAYVLDGGTGTGLASADCGSPFYIPYPTKANYVFGGWTAANLTTASSKAGQSSGQLSAWDGTKNVGPYFQDLSTTDGATVTLTAVWQGESRTITVKASPIDKGTVSGGGVYEYNTSCTISASPTGTNVFIGWYKGGQLVSSSASFTFTVTEDATYSAYFEVSASTKLVLRASPTFDIVLGDIAMYSVSSSRVHNNYSIGEGGDVAEMSGNVDESGNTNVFIKRGSLSPGYHRIQVMATSGTNPVQTASVTTELFVSLPAVDTVMDRWRFVIFRSDGSYIAVSDLIHGVLASVMPEVRLEKNAPSKAVIQLTCPRGTNVRSSSFSGWSNGVAGPISEGQFLAVDYLDDSTGTVVRRFCGTIRKAENAGTRVTLTAYDRLMELYEKADPYQIFGGIANDQRSRSRAVGTGDTYGFTMWDLIASGGILAISFVDLENINTFYDYTQGLVYPEASERISEIGYRMTAAYGHIRRVRVHAAPSAHPGGGYEYGVSVGVRLYECNQSTGRPISLISDTGWHYVDATADPYNANLEIYANWDVIVGKKYFISAYYICDDPTDDNLAYRYRAGLESTPYTFRRKRDSSVWTSGGIPKGPDAYYVGIGIEYEKIRSSDSYASSASLGTDRHIIVCPTSNVAPTGNPTLEGIAIYATYIIDSSASVTGKSVSVIVSELVERAGLKPSLTGEDDDSRRISFYNSSSYDYLSAIQELVQSAGYDGTSYFLRGVQDDPSMPGRIRIGRLALPDASASGMAVTTDPYADGVHDVASHSLKRTFEEEVTAPIVLSQDTTDDSPIAIQTDDRLFSDSKIAEFGHEYVKIYTDNTLQDHTMLALSAESMVRKIHYNALEGDMELVGLYPSMWDIGGRCLKVDIPEYGADSYAVPSIMVLGSYRTAMTMDNVRSDNRSALYSTMTQSSDAQSYTVSGIGDASYIFLRSPSLLTLTGTVTVEILGRDGTSLGSTMTVKRVSDRASDAAGKGYDHIAALFPKSSSGYAPGNTYVKYVRISTPTAGESYTLLVPNPVYGWPGQYIHIDVRMPN